MGLDVGVVTFKYLERPRGPTYRFVCHLAESYCESDWEFGEGGNTLAQYLPETLERLADKYAESEGMRREEREAVMGWVKALPWDNGVVTLHFSW